jgi:UDP-glucose 4-epimerase
MRALVTGGAGFIGSHLVDALLERGDEVEVLDDLSTGRRENLSGALEAGARLVEADVSDDTSVAGTIESRPPDVIFHLAGQIDVRVSVSDPFLDARVNVGGTINVLDAARQAGTRRVVFASTGGAIYGDVPHPVEEDHPRAPVSPYGTAKLAGEEYVLTWNRLYATQHVIVRYGNVYGPRQDPHGEAGVVAIFLQKVARGEVPTIFGDGSQVRDYVYVRDVARATLAAVDAEPDVFNVGSGSGSSLLELVEKMRDAVGRPFPVEHAPERIGELHHIELDVTRAARQLGWQPETPLEDGLREAWEYFRNHR